MGKAKKYVRTAVSAFFDPTESVGLERPIKSKPKKKKKKYTSKTTTAGKLKMVGRHK